MTPVRIEPATPQSRIKHSSTEPLRSLRFGSEFRNYTGKWENAGHVETTVNKTEFITIKFMIIIIHRFR